MKSCTRCDAEKLDREFNHNGRRDPKGRRMRRARCRDCDREVRNFRKTEIQENPGRGR